MERHTIEAAWRWRPGAAARRSTSCERDALLRTVARAADVQLT